MVRRNINTEYSHTQAHNDFESVFPGDEAATVPDGITEAFVLNQFCDITVRHQ